MNDEFNQRPAEVKDNIIEKIRAIDTKINYYVEEADKLGEDGQVDQAENVMREIEKMKIEKVDLQSQLENPANQKDEISKNVCHICGAMQSITDTD